MKIYGVSFSCPVPQLRRSANINAAPIPLVEADVSELGLAFLHDIIRN